MTEQIEAMGKAPEGGSASDPKGKTVKGNEKPKPHKKVDKPQREELAGRVSGQLNEMRGLLKEVGDTLVARLDGDIAALAQYLAGQGLHGDKPVLPPARELETMLSELAALKVKPKKGRVKDLARIESLLESLSKRMPPGV